MRDYMRKIRSAFNRRDMFRLGVATVSVSIPGLRSVHGQRLGSARYVKPKDDLTLRKRNVTNLKRIGQAMHSYVDAHGHFPPAALTDSAGTPLLSWRVAILPYLAHFDLFKRFKRDEPWDGASNSKLLNEMPEVYAPVSCGPTARSDTLYRGFVGDGAFFEGVDGIKIADITDGTVNTIMVVEAGEPVAWTKPEDLPIECGSYVPRLGGQFEEGFHALYCDGSVRFLAKEIDADMLRWAITRNDGEVITLDRELRAYQRQRHEGELHCSSG
jgi:Protein of unknown function (DUF1559)